MEGETQCAGVYLYIFSPCLPSANRDQVMDQLKLALAWNRIDIAKSEIFTDERPWPVSGCPFVLNCPNFNCKKMYVIYDSLQQDVCHL